MKYVFTCEAEGSLATVVVMPGSLKARAAELGKSKDAQLTVKTEITNDYVNELCRFANFKAFAK